MVSVGVDVILAGSGVSGWCGVGGRWRGHDFRGGICGVVVAVVLADVDTVVFEGVIVIMTKGVIVISVALVCGGTDDGDDQLIIANQEWIEDQVASLS